MPEPGEIAVGGGTLEGGGLDGDNWNVGADGMKILIEVGTAWAVVKILLPVRLVGCVWLTPWFARVVVLPVTRVMGRVAGRSKSVARVVGKGKDGIK